MRTETKQEREAWTAHVEGSKPIRQNKYGNEQAGKYASKHERQVATNLAALNACGKIAGLQEQVSYTLVPGQGKIKPIRYVADFVYLDTDGVIHVCDAKGYTKDKVYRLKKKLMLLMHGICVEEL